MTQSFDKFTQMMFMSKELEDAYEAGAQSRQAEIDGLGALSEMSEQKIDDLVLRNIKLQKRIDEALKICDNLRTDLIRENHVEYDKGWKDCATSIYHQLRKGESND